MSLTPEKTAAASLLLPSRSGRLMGAALRATGGYVPERIVTNDDLEAQGFDGDWIRQRTGIVERRFVAAEMATSDMAAEAARRCLQQAGVSPHAVDLVVVSTSSPDYPMPSTAALVQDRLGLRAMAYDIQAACSGFVVALMAGMQHVLTGTGQAALVIAAECHSRIINPADDQTYPLFGDGAAAALVVPGGPEQGLLSFVVGSDGSGADLVVRAMGGARVPHVEQPDDPRRYLVMDGRTVFKWAVRTVADTVGQALAAAGVALDDIRLVAFHQANLRILNAAIEKLGIDPAKVAINLDRYGNTGSASIPLVLDEAVRQGRIERGDLILLSGFGAGLSWATAVMRW